MDTGGISGNDSLTKVYGREKFFEKARKMIDEKDNGYYILSCINIDNFKVINDRYGMDAGDMVLQHVAGCICSCLIDIGGICGLISGDDFAALYPVSYANSERVLNSHNKTASPDCMVQKIKLRMGRFVVDASSSSVETMYDYAKIAANAIRNNYEKDVEYYNNFMKEEPIRKQKIVYEMNDALKNGQFEPWFQPQYNHAAGAMIGGGGFGALEQGRHMCFAG